MTRTLFAKQIRAIAADRPKLSAVAETLRNVRSLSAEHRAAALKAMRDAGHIEDDVRDDGLMLATAHASQHGNMAAAAGFVKLSPLQAAALASNNPRMMALYRKVAAQSARYGIDFGGDGVLDIYAIDAKLRAANVPLEMRLAYKASLHELRCI